MTCSDMMLVCGWSRTRASLDAATHATGTALRVPWQQEEGGADAEVATKRQTETHVSMQTSEGEEECKRSRSAGNFCLFSILTTWPAFNCRSDDASEPNHQSDRQPGGERGQGTVMGGWVARQRRQHASMCVRDGRIGGVGK